MTEQSSIHQDIELAAKILQEAGAQEVFVFRLRKPWYGTPRLRYRSGRPGAYRPRDFFPNYDQDRIAISRPFDLVRSG